MSISKVLLSRFAPVTAIDAHYLILFIVSSARVDHDRIVCVNRAVGSHADEPLRRFGGIVSVISCAILEEETNSV